MPRRPSPEAHVRPMSDVAVRPVEWLWPRWIPLGKVTILDGDPGMGKSTLLLDLAARLSRDGLMPDGAVGRVGSSLILSAEDGEADTIKPRLEAAGGVAERLFTLPAVQGDDGEDARRKSRATCRSSRRQWRSTPPASSSSTRSWRT